MRLYISEKKEVLVAGSVQELNGVADQISKFLLSGDESLYLSTSVDGLPSPYDSFLAGIEITKLRNSPIDVQIGSNGLCISGSTQNLKTYFQHFRFNNDASAGTHRHPELVNAENYISANAIPVTIEVR